MTTLTKMASAGEGTDEQVPVYSGVCAHDGCTFQTLWHRDEGNAALALLRHIAARHVEDECDHQYERDDCGVGRCYCGLVQFPLGG